MNNPETSERITFTKAYSSIGFRQVLFPIDVKLLLNILPEEGYILEEDVAKIRHRFGPQISLSGDIARKGDFRLALSSEKGFIGIDGPDPESVLEEIVNIKKILQDRLEIQIDEMASFYEFLAEGSLKGAKPPIQTFPLVSKQLNLISMIAKILEENVSLYGLRLATSGQDPNRAEYLDFRLEPNVTSAMNLYSFSAVYRKKKFDLVAKFANSFTKKLRNFINLLERLE
ncbi:MAG: hypothetical protein Q7R34_05870 [Dehalococcoidia bacterium]|nr:hypothetical protein [Dehalococcoidia bacterium]